MSSHLMKKGEYSIEIRAAAEGGATGILQFKLKLICGTKSMSYKSLNP